MYFGMLFLLGVCFALGAMIGTQHWFLLAWAMLMLLYFFVQRTVAVLFAPAAAREAFSCALLVQSALSVSVAIATHGIGASLIAFGIVANCVVVMANGGSMPTLHGCVPNHCYVEMNESTRLPWLCDILPVTPIGQAILVISLGDVFECIGVWVLAAELLLH